VIKIRAESSVKFLHQCGYFTHHKSAKPVTTFVQP